MEALKPIGAYIIVTGAYLTPVVVLFDWCCAAHVAEALRESMYPVWVDSLDTEGRVIPEWGLR